ncbi:MAG: CAP domain-containing protein [Candidatus Nitrosopumilus sp. bin_6a]
MRFEGSNCPICHSKKQTNAKPAAIGVVIIGTVIMLGVLVYAGEIQIDQANLEQSIETMPGNIQDVGNTVGNIASETSEKLSNTIRKNIEISDIEPTINQITKKVTEIKENIPESAQIQNTIIQKPSHDSSMIGKLVHQYTNEQRKQHGLNQLSVDRNLEKIAYDHSHDMAINNFFDHVNLKGMEPTDRANNARYSCVKDYGSYYTDGIAENIFQNNLYNSISYINGIPTSYDWNTNEDIARQVVSGWMNSPGHRANILESTYDREGIGVAIADDDKVYVTQNFC